MEPQTSLPRASTITTDASTIINLNATNCARDIIHALDQKFVVVDIVKGELETGRQNGRRDADHLNSLLADQILELVTLDGAAMTHYESLVVGPAASTLDDGEAATIAYSIMAGATAAIDERKATTLCSVRFPQVSLCSTVDILAQPSVQSALGRDELAAAVFRALTQGRMRVLPHNVKWVVELIGHEKASICTSLPRDIRRLSETFLSK